MADHTLLARLAKPGEPFRIGPTETARRTCYDRDFAIQLAHPLLQQPTSTLMQIIGAGQRTSEGRAVLRERP